MHSSEAGRCVVLGAILLGVAGAVSAAPGDAAGQPSRTRTPVAARSRIFPPNPTAPKARTELQDAVAYVMSLSEEEMLALVPDRAGLSRVGCPHCSAGKKMRDAFEWDPRHPNRLECRACAGSVPDPGFPTDEVTRVQAPSGRRLEYRYWKGEGGQRFYLPAHVDWQKRVYMRDRCVDLALLYHLGGERRHARRAALILNRFAETFPDYVYHFDYPNRNPRFFDGEVPPESFLKGYRTARWSDWAYVDIPTELIFAFELIRDSGELERIPGAGERIVEDFFLPSTRQVAANPETFTNLSPFVWEGMAAAGLVLGRSEYLQGIADRLDEFTQRQFFYDGMWKEGSFSYHSQALKGIDRVRNLLAGSDAFSSPGDPVAETLARVEARALAAHWAFDGLRLPSGRSPAFHDSWERTGGLPIDRSEPRLLGGLGHALLASGEGTRQVQAHLSWSGGYGHHHYDALSLLFFAEGAELISDIGYTHTRLRGWTMATAAHNTVVVDLENQIDGPDSPSPGRLLRLDWSHPEVQLVAAANPLAYPKTVTRYERMLALVDTGAERTYLVDLFRVAGGKQHDYFLHGSAQVKQGCSIAGEAACQRGHGRGSLAPGKPKAPRSSADLFDVQKRGNAYQFLEESTRRSVDRPAVLPVAFVSPEAHSVAHLVLEKGDELVTGVSPQVRPAKERESDLDAHTRPFLMLRRRPGDAADRFVSVIQALGASGPGVYSVTRLPMTGTGTALLIRGKHFSDLIALDAQDLRAEYDDRTLRAEGEFSLVRLAKNGGFLYTTGRASYGKLAANAPPRSRSALVLAEEHDGTGRFIFERSGTTPIPMAGDTLLLEHGDGATHGYTIERSTPRQDTVEIWTKEPPGFRISERGADVRFERFPGTSHPAPTTAIWQPAASVQGVP